MADEADEKENSDQAHTSGVTKGEDQAPTEAEGSEREGPRPAGSVNEQGSSGVIESSGTVDMPPG